MKTNKLNTTAVKIFISYAIMLGLFASGSMALALVQVFLLFIK